MVKGDHPGGSLAGNESLLASSTRSVGLGVSEAFRLLPGTAPVSAFPAPARSSGLIIARSLDGLISWFSATAFPPGGVPLAQLESLQQKLKVDQTPWDC